MPLIIAKTLLTLGAKLVSVYNMNHVKFIAGIATGCICLAACSTSGPLGTSTAHGTIPAGTTLTARTTSKISERDPVGSTFTGQLDQNVVVNGATMLRAGTGVTGRVTASRGSLTGRSSAPLRVALTSLNVNGGNVAIKTHSVRQSGAATVQTTQVSSRNVTVGTVLVPPGTTMQFVLAQAVTF
jgi:hypothetical protein